MAGVISIIDLLSRLKNDALPLFDARSEGEYNKGHIPGAINIPLLNNEQRAIIGTTFKQHGRQEAVIKGFELVGPFFYEKILKAKAVSEKPEVMVYCWRGGLRSNILGWLLSMSGFKVWLLQGGYKSYRKWALSQFEIPFNLTILGGKTGSGKTEMLQLIKSKGEQVICLESLANHKGSAYGSLGQALQPTQEHFENQLSLLLGSMNKSFRIWLENESRNIGFIKIPDPLFTQMRHSPVIEMVVDEVIRRKRILDEYGNFPDDVLIEKTMKLQKRMGGQNVKAAVECLKENDKNGWVKLLLNYYDKTYSHGNSLREVDKVQLANVDWNNPINDASGIIAMAEE